MLSNIKTKPQLPAGVSVQKDVTNFAPKNCHQLSAQIDRILPGKMDLRASKEKQRVQSFT